MSLAKDFKDFISRGNVIDLAVGVIIGGAFGKIVDSLVKDVVMPPISYAMKGVDVSSLKILIVPAATGKPEVAVAYGNFLQAGLNFFIIALVIFLLIRLIQSIRKDTPPPAPGPTQEELLTQIRDLLAKSPSK